MNADQKEVLSKAQKLSHWKAQKLYYCIGKSAQRSWKVKRGEVYFVDLGENIGSEENKLRPVVVLQSNAYNFHSPTFTCAIISSSPMTIPDIQVPITHTYTYADNTGAHRNLVGTVDLGQIKTVGKERIVSKTICKLLEMADVDAKLLNALGMSRLIQAKNNEITSLKGKIEYLSQQIENKKTE